MQSHTSIRSFLDSIEKALRATKSFLRREIEGAGALGLHQMQQSNLYIFM